MLLSISVGSPTQNVITDQLVDEKGSHEDIYQFASRADIVICCLIMNKETVSAVKISSQLVKSYL